MNEHNPQEKIYSSGEKVLDLKNLNEFQNKRKRKSIFKKVLTLILVLLLGSGLWYGLRTNQALENISTKSGTLFEKIIHLLPVDKSFLLKLPIERSVFEEPNTADKRINYLVLGIRGEGDPNGGMLTDSILVMSVKPSDNKISLISIPRDLYVDMPGMNEKRKLNEAYEIGELKFSGKGLEYVKSIVSDISGVKIHYEVLVNFEGYKDLIDSLGGVELTLDKPFNEVVPFAEGSINLPAGRQTLDGATSLLYARARMSSSDFDRSRRQQDIIKAAYAKILRTQFLLNPYRVNKMLGVLENNVKTDMKVWEIEETIKLFAGLNSPVIKTKVIDNNGPNNILHSSYNSEGAYILVPTEGNYNRIHEIVKNIFN